jgi:hypothetical protein
VRYKASNVILHHTKSIHTYGSRENPFKPDPCAFRVPEDFDELVALDPNQAAARRALQQVPEDIAAAELGALDLNQVAPDPDSSLRLQLQQAKDSFAFTWSDIPAPHSAIPISDQQIAEYKDKPQSTIKKIFVLFEGGHARRGMPSGFGYLHGGGCALCG